jgi:hypothetical protein
MARGICAGCVRACQRTEAAGVRVGGRAHQAAALHH